MTDEKRDALAEEELRAAEGEQLPAREVMSIIMPEPDPLPAADAGVAPDDPSTTDGTSENQGPLKGGEPASPGADRPEPL